MDLNLPPFEMKLRKSAGKEQIYDPIRRKYVALTPEERVRQHFIHFLVNYMRYPLHRLANEIEISLFRTSKRCDTVVYGDHSVPIAIIEYKAPHVKISEDTFNQIARYNILMKVKFLIVTNGLNHYVCQVDYDNQSISYLSAIPSYEELSLLHP